MRRVLQKQTRLKRMNLKNLQKNLKRIWRRRRRYAKRVRMLRNLKNGKLKKEFLKKKKSVDSEKNGSFYQRILSWIQKIKCTFGKLCDKIKSIVGKERKVGRISSR